MIVDSIYLAVLLHTSGEERLSNQGPMRYALLQCQDTASPGQWNKAQ